MLKVRTADVGFYMTGMRVHRHESAAQVALQPFDGVVGSHHRVRHAVLITEYLHLTRCLEGAHDGIGTDTGAFHHAVTVALTDGAVHDAVHLFLGQRTREGSVLFLLQLFEETLLLCLHMLVHGFFGVLLHPRIDGRVYLQTILIYIIFASVGLAVLLAETV